jgi:SAM-dependent methyltransferase
MRKKSPLPIASNNPTLGLTGRLRHPDVLVFLLGGFLGSALNLRVFVVLYALFQWNPALACFCSTFLNEAFHHVYYRTVYVNEEIQFRTPGAIQWFLYVWTALGSALIFFALFQWVHLSVWVAILLTLVILSISNTLFVRISTFGSAHLAEVEYLEMNESYYDDQTNEEKVSKFRAWYHRSRYEKLTKFVERHYKKGMKVADLGCGNCWWNVHSLPVTGVDINPKMLGWAKKNKRLKDFKVTGNLGKTGLASASYDLVIMTETLEHILDLEGVLKEVRRILKPNGTFLITVPYDVFLGPFFILFNINCFYMGYIRGSQYHKYRCGHINHFTKSRMSQTLAANGFSMKSSFLVNFLLLYAVARKSGAKS